MQVQQGSLPPTAILDFAVRVDTGSQTPKQIELVQSWLTLWCKRHCKSSWHISVNRVGNQDGLLLEFEDHREAIYFKLSNEFLRNNQATYFLVH